MATAMYGAQQAIATPTSFVSDDASANDEQYISTFFCRALYDYQTSDASSLSFRKGDIIEVLTQLESGWWDGLLGNERGWFPSNYVSVITDQEVEAALGPPELSASQPPLLSDDAIVDVAQGMSGALSQSDGDRGWLNGDMDLPSHAPHSEDYTDGSNGHLPQHNDFWVPQVSQDGRIFYVNTQTGQQSRDLPQETDIESDADFAGLTSRVGPVTGLGLTTASGMEHEHGTTAGFGIQRTSRTPEPWARRLADDGLSYYYVNKLNGQVSWTPPEPPAAPGQTSSRNGSLHGRDAPQPANGVSSEPSVPTRRERSNSNADRYSINSEDSDIFPTRRDRSASSGAAQNPANGAVHLPNAARNADLTPPEQLAKALQQALSPPSPESPVDLSTHVREAIAAITQQIQLAVTPRNPDQLNELDQRVQDVVSTVRNLLYVTATPSGHIPSHLYPREARDTRPSTAGQSMQSHLKAAQRKVAGTLSKLVLSALAMQYDPTLSASDKPNRMESDVAELERAVVAFVTEVHYFQEQNALPQGQKYGLKRLYGTFSTANIGLGLPGAGAAGSWQGFGYVPRNETAQSTLQPFVPDHISELKIATRALGEKLSVVTRLLKRDDADTARVKDESQNVVAHLTSILDFIGNIDIAQHTDLDGVRLEAGQSRVHAQYMQVVDKARLIVRTLEAAVQSLYDDGISLLITIQNFEYAQTNIQDRTALRDRIDALVAAIIANVNLTMQSLEALLAVGFDQADIDNRDYLSSIEWRKSRPVVAEDSQEVVDIELAFNSSGAMKMVNPMDRTQSSSTLCQDSAHAAGPSGGPIGRSRSGSTVDPVTPSWPTEPSESGTLVMPSTEDLVGSGPLGDLDEDDSAVSSKAAPRAEKLKKLLGDDAPQYTLSKLDEKSKPWYLRPNYDQSEIIMEPDGTVRAGTTSALVDRLTAHEHGDPTFNQNFLLTFKSFMTVDELFELLTRRFWIQAPPSLSPAELEDWTKLKQNIIRMRVLNIFKTMVTDDGILEKDDMYILSRMKEFVFNDEVITYAAAKQLLILIERAQKGGNGPIKITTVPEAPPPPLIPRGNKKPKLLDIDPIEIARQLTLMEAAMYKKIRPMECLLRSREQKSGRSGDNFSSIIQLSNRIANWVMDSVLEREDSRKRAAIVKHFILVADRCRSLQNYSTMTAIVSGLATPPIRRLKRTWEQVNARIMSQLRMCESTIDSTKNFSNYRSTLARISPPCVPFIGVYLTTLTFINDGAEDRIDGNMINFRKRQKAAEVIQDIKRWQSKPYNYQTVGSVLSYLEESFVKYADGFDYADQFWNLSLEREPREREDEKMARLLQESGFL
ncbi:ras GEF [Laetiporus sulphureus 93-53]|uniref:Ras GEF n=1 Tax=Laetiporus sulphureus 93-53 TaxID=1314785 RepID=A0A165HNW7_9APHY|nr:ras GEF [Laetiporus sulphureus 93-53]KZT11988.1 ras GEF [Laetiporus sulphureus 93-53]